MSGIDKSLSFSDTVGGFWLYKVQIQGFDGRDMAGNDGLTSAHYLAALIDMLVEQGCSQEALLAGSGLLPQELKMSDSYLQYAVVERIINNAVALTQSESLGLQLGQRLHISAHQQIGYAALTASNTEQAIFTAIRYIPLITELIALTYVKETETVSIEVNVASFVSANVGALIVQTLVSSLSVMMQYLLGDKAKGVAIELRQSRPKSNVDTAQKLRYHCEHDRVVFDRDLLAVSFTLSDEQAHKQAVEVCEKSLKLMREASSMGQRIMRQLLTSRQAIADIETIAQQWHMSSRTLRRRLHDEGFSFRDLVTQAKMQKAKQYLLEDRLPITEVAYLLEYKDSANFTRAFKRSEGMTPSEFLRNA